MNRIIKLEFEFSPTYLINVQRVPNLLVVGIMIIQLDDGVKVQVYIGDIYRSGSGPLK